MPKSTAASEVLSSCNPLCHAETRIVTEFDMRGPSGMHISKTLKRKNCDDNTHQQPSKKKKSGPTFCTRKPISVPCSPEDSKDEIEGRLRELCSSVRRSLPKIVGFPGNFEPRQEILDDIMGTTLNNHGDPYVGDHEFLNSMSFELGVLEWFASLWEIKLEESWGYVTNGSTEANLQAMYMAREALPNGIIYTSSETHHSVPKAARILRMDVEEIGCSESGEMDYSALKKRLMKNAGVPAIINANIGTTMTGAIDNVDKILQALNDAGYRKKDFYLHCDAALMGIVLPFLQDPCNITFKKPIDSINVSGHKFLGTTIPCGVFMTRRKYKYLEGMKKYVEVVDCVDNTISGSRNGHSAVQLWYALAKRGTEGVKKDCLDCVKKAQYLHKMLTEAGIDSKLLDHSITVYFPQPSKQKEMDWVFASANTISHVVTMQNVSEKNLQDFVSDLILYQ